MTQIAVLFEGSGRRSEKTFTTIDETVEYLAAHGYTRVSGAPHYRPSIATRLYRETRSGRYARINTSSSPGCWPVVVDQVHERRHLDAAPRPDENGDTDHGH